MNSVTLDDNEYPPGSQLRQEKERELENQAANEEVAPETSGETEPEQNSEVPESEWNKDGQS